VSAITWTLTVTSALLTGSLLTKEARSGPKLALKPQQRADCDENKLRLVRARGESYSDVIPRLARVR
jgi:hypothetical protein